MRLAFLSLNNKSPRRKGDRHRFAIESLTINIAKQMLIEKERGSISEGKYADFLLVTKDVLSCPETEIHEAKPEATYFEGKKVFANQ